ncbi:MAG: hypothetical protein CVV33_08230 [Methanomicrobiales archaeon HGW-Methanomicrobiales-4]|nr:MAG: hypothetical protein CVV33_08230 [Methanomicrobiales archaeon HGW-Methanomicrobiales-4]
MTAGPEYLNRRAAGYIARDLLIKQGFEVVRVAERHSTTRTGFHLIAWNDQSGVIFIRVRGSRIRRTSCSLQEELSLLCAHVLTRRYPGELQYWVRDGDTWTRYRIYAGGAVRIPEAGSDIR